MTWFDLKKYLDANVKDDTDLADIDWSEGYELRIKTYPSGRVKVVNGPLVGEDE